MPDTEENRKEFEYPELDDMFGSAGSFQHGNALLAPPAQSFGSETQKLPSVQNLMNYHRELQLGSQNIQPVNLDPVNLDPEENKEPRLMQIDTTNTLYNEFKQGAQVSASVEILDDTDDLIIDQSIPQSRAQSR